MSLQDLEDKHAAVQKKRIRWLTMLWIFVGVFAAAALTCGRWE